MMTIASGGQLPKKVCHEGPDYPAQRGDQENGIHEVAGSIPASSTNSSRDLAKRPSDEGRHSSRMSLDGSTASARRAGMADAAMPSSAMVSTAPPKTTGSTGFA